MVLLVPDDSDEMADDLTPEDQEADSQQKAQLDDSEASKASQKVDLDLDDAPFLEDEDEDEDDVEFEEEETPLFEEEEEEGDSRFDFKALFRNKLFLIALSVIILLLIVILVLLLRDPAPEPAPAPAPQEMTEEAQVPEPEPETTPEILIRLDPFLIEQRDGENNVRFLEVRVVVSTEDDGLARQFKQETYVVRNAVFYYLRNKDLQFLSDEDNSEQLKSELLAIVNQYMGFGQFDTLLFEQYLVR